MWKRELTRLHSKSWALPLPLDRWKHKTYRKWKYWLDEENDELTVSTEQEVEVYVKVLGGQTPIQEKGWGTAGGACG